jgi:pimeloyl-ACP methyl ester carboxylesterase
MNIFKEIEFKSQEATLRGRLYIPEDMAQKCSVIVMAHGFTSTINGMTADRYAERFREAGFAVLLYDHRNFGISDGEPRQELNFWVQSRGYIDAIDFLNGQSEIELNKIAVWGASMSARQAFLVGTIDKRIDAIITMIPAFGNDLPSKDNGQNSYTFAKNTLLKDDILKLTHSVTEQMPIVSHDQISAPSRLTELTAYRWFLEYGGRFATNWKNVVSVSNIEMPHDFHLGHCASQLKAPILMIVATNDEMNGAKTDVTSVVFKRVKQVKEWVDIEGGHFGLLYYPSPIFEKSSKAQISFLKEHLV